VIDANLIVIDGNADHRSEIKAPVQISSA